MTEHLAKMYQTSLKLKNVQFSAHNTVYKFQKFWSLRLSLLVRPVASRIISSVARSVKKVGQHWSIYQSFISQNLVA